MSDQERYYLEVMRWGRVFVRHAYIPLFLGAGWTLPPTQTGPCTHGLWLVKTRESKP